MPIVVSAVFVFIALSIIHSMLGWHKGDMIRSSSLCSPHTSRAARAGRATDRYPPAVFRTFFDEALQPGTTAIVLNAASGEVIGSSRYHAYVPDRRQVEVGWTFVARRCWGDRYDAEVKSVARSRRWVTPSGGSEGGLTRRLQLAGGTRKEEIHWRGNSRLVRAGGTP